MKILLNSSTCIFIVLFWYFKTAYAAEERSILDEFIQPFRVFRLKTSSALRSMFDNSANYKALSKRKRVQEIIPDSVSFPCNVTFSTSDTVPTSVHKLRPGDIKVIGAIGDSLTAGFGLSASNLLGVFLEDRGKSFSIGGQGTWRKYMTLPNILREFNPKLIGYSLRPSLTIERDSQFNVAEGGAVSKNMPYMSKILIQRIKSDKRVDYNNDWKMVTVMIGDNDFCSEMCYYKNYSVCLSNHKEDLLKVLRTLRDNLPRTIVNVVPPPFLEVLTQMHDKPPHCYTTHSISCPCLLGLAYQSKIDLHFNMMKKWQNIDIELSKLPEFNLETFTVVAQPIFLNYTFPRTKEGGVDYTYLSYDCFHLSQKGNARIANDLWNSIMEPVGKKDIDGSDLLTKFNCPTGRNPYIYTNINSVWTE